MSLKTSAIIVVASLWSLSACSRSTTPSIVLITVDTLRADRLGCYGYEGARTPNIDQLATEGVRVEHAIAPTPITLPSHTSILTGLEPPAHGVRDNGTYRVPDAAVTLAERLKAEGYETQAFVSAEVLHRRFNLNQGFDGYDDELWSEASPEDFMFRERSGQRTMDRVLQWLEAPRTQSSTQSPFFLWVHLFDPHDPYEPPEADARLSPTPYDGEIASVDRQIGRLMEALERTGDLKDTILVFTSDHGESLGEHQEGTHSIFIYESTVRVPLIFRYPRKLPAGKVYGAPARSVDIMPTVLALAGKQPSDTQGADLSEAMTGSARGPSPAQYSESLHPKLAFGMAPLQGIRSDAWTYIRAPRAELYNRRADPREMRNLLGGDSSEAATAQALELDATLTDIVESSKRFGLVAEARPLDPQTTAMLQALGYMGDSETPDNLGGMDPKDGVQIFDKVNRSIALTQVGDCAKATEMLRSVLKQLPGHVRARNTLAKCEARAGQLGVAREHYLKSLAHEPQQPYVFLQIGRIDFAEGRNESARRRFSEALEIIPDSVEAMMLMGYLELSEGSADKATRWYARAIAADPRNPEPYLQQGDLYFRKKKFEEARGWYEKALDVAPATYAAAFQAGMCALQLGDQIAAEKYLVRASEIDGSRWQPLYSLACVQAQAGDVSSAVDYLQDAVKKGFGNVAQLQTDPCMASLHDQPSFQRLVNALRGVAPQ